MGRRDQITRFLPIVALAYLGMQVLAGCGSPSKTMAYHDYIKWANDPSNGLVKEKHINGLVMKVQYIPAALTAYRLHDKIEKGKTGVEKEASMTFLLTMVPEGADATSSGGDLMMADVTNMEEYKEKFMQMHFALGEYAELLVDSTRFSPTLFQLEPTYGLAKELVTTFVFSPKTSKEELLKGSDYDFVFDDRFFGTGKNHFRFLKSDMENVPTLLQ